MGRISAASDGVERTTFVALDGLRGVAALAVVFFHISNFTGVTLLPGAYLAVDLFFCISGFVLTHAYADRLHGGMETGSFMVRRLIRLYPLHCLSGLLVLAYIFALGDADNFAGNGPTCYLLNMMLIPMPIGWSWHADIMPLNFVAWSILLELLASLLFVRFIHVLIVRPHLHRIIMIAGLALVVSAIGYGDLNLGVSFAHLPGALARALFSFCAGIAIVLARRDGKALPAFSFPLVAMAAIVPMALSLTGAMRIAGDLLVVMLLFPALVHAAASCRIEGATRHIAMTLGSASYALYILQVPMIAIVASALTAMGWPPSIALGLGFTGGLLAVAILVDRHVDRPLRGWLAHSIASRKYAALPRYPALAR